MLAALTMAALIAIGVDFVTVEGDIGRMNTLFKYYLEVWVFMAIVAAYMLWRLMPAWVSQLRLRRPALAASWLSVLVMLVACSLIYTVLGARDRVNDRFVDLPPTLDGMAFMAEAEHWEREESLPLMWDLQAIR